MRIRAFLLLLFFVSPVIKAHAALLEASCAPFTDGCLYLLASKEMHGARGSNAAVPLFKLAFHAGRMGYERIPGGDLDFAPERLQRKAVSYLDLGRDVGAERVIMNLDKPISGLKSLLVAPYVLAPALIDLSQTDVQSVLVSSALSPSSQGMVLGRLLAMELNEGKYRFINAQLDQHINYLLANRQPFLAVASLAITLAEEGYTREANDIIARHLAHDDHLRAQDFLLYVQAIQAVFDDDVFKVVSLVSAIQSRILRLEALGHVYAMTRDQFIGKQYLSALYDFSNPLTPLERRNLVLFAISMLD